MDDEASAVATWEAILAAARDPVDLPRLAEVAAARVRDGDLQGAIAAYREADRRAPPEDKPEIANRLGWLAKETGNVRASRRYFARGRGDASCRSRPTRSSAITIVDLADGESSRPRAVPASTALAARQAGRRRRGVLAAVDGDARPRRISLHLGFNMYALYLAGPLVERWYGPVRFLAFYLVARGRRIVGELRVRRRSFRRSAHRARSSGCSGVLLAARVSTCRARPTEPGARSASSAC